MKADVYLNTNLSLELREKMLAQINKALPDEMFEILVKVKGSWLVRNELAETWKQLRGKPDWVIDDDFSDYLTLHQAESLGLIPKPSN
ncbi:hypothetical protein GXP67_02830 [Rhodocytophaga rosea]|uniref:Uncharacterized protein n=1 Tax=Rhodocytophaga rosea TaxID=2704465 RepID=A0A6C0GCI8_9BACT|nr:hypothetical protein [Rhodocytophaga rosea]QHT65675.1 hypothetical protein GXP67_02830 [Rhodocytophaga rosea]